MKLTEQDLKQIISESIKKIIKEEAENNDKVIDLISFLHNAQLPVREIHWNTRNNALHLLTDEIIDNLFEWEDTLSEAFISSKNLTLKINSTSPSSSEDIKSILNELIEKATSVKKDNDNAICAVIDDILEKTNKYLYRADFK